MSRSATYITGRALSLVLIVGFNVLIVKIASSAEYAVYAVLAAGASIVNTLAGLGTQRLVPKIIGMAGRSITRRRAAHIYQVILISRFVLLSIVGVGTFYFFRWFTASNLAMSGALLVPYVIFSTLSSLYLDIEAASQSLNQQKISRMAAIGEPTARLLIIAALAFLPLGRTAVAFLTISCVTQGLSVLALAINNFRFLYQSEEGPLPEPREITWNELLKLGGAAYLSGAAWISTAPPTLRLMAASVLPAPAIAVLSFVQSLGASFQRYSPGFLMIPFVEAQVMRQSRTHDSGRVGAMLGLVWKVDLIISLLLICAITPAAPMLLTLAAKREFASYGLYIGLVLMPVPLGTVYRALEVGSVFIESYAAIVRASMLTLISFLALVLLRHSVGIIFILLIPILDNFIRCAYLEGQIKKGGLSGVVHWPPVVLVVMAGLIVNVLAQQTLAWPWAWQVAAGVLASCAGMVVLKWSGIVSPADVALIGQRLPAKATRVIRLLFLRPQRPVGEAVG